MASSAGYTRRARWTAAVTARAKAATSQAPLEKESTRPGDDDRPVCRLQGRLDPVRGAPAQEDQGDDGGQETAINVLVEKVPEDEGGDAVAKNAEPVNLIEDRGATRPDQELGRQPRRARRRGEPEQEVDGQTDRQPKERGLGQPEAGGIGEGTEGGKEKEDRPRSWAATGRCSRGVITLASRNRQGTAARISQMKPEMLFPSEGMRRQKAAKAREGNVF